VVGSSLLDKDAFSNPDLKKYLMAATPPNGGLSLDMIAGPAVHSKPVELNSVNPAWRRMYSHTTNHVGWVPLNSWIARLGDAKDN
jgi:hypothetical protein